MSRARNAPTLRAGEVASHANFGESSVMSASRAPNASNAIFNVNLPPLVLSLPLFSPEQAHISN
ncbi:unnamed protein product [Penicillium bialowiezense]